MVIGAGMVAHRFIESLRAQDSNGVWAITVIGDEPWRPYDRVQLTSTFSGVDPAALELGRPLMWSHPNVTLRTSETVTSIHPETRTVVTSLGATEHYDELVVATGSAAAKPPIVGVDAPGVHVYRTVQDVVQLKAEVAELSQRLGRTVRGAVVGGGLLGLEAAGAMVALGATCTVVQSSGHLMSAQLDAGGGEALRLLIEHLGVDVRTGSRASAVVLDADGRAAGLVFPNGEPEPADLVVFAVGITPRDELARGAGSRSALAVASRSTRPAVHLSQASRRSARLPRSTASASGSWPPATPWPRSSRTGSPGRGDVPRCRPLDEAQAHGRRRCELR